MEEIIETTKNTKPIQTLKNMSFNGVLEDFNNKLIYLEQMSEGISEEYADEQLFNTEQLVLNSKKLQNKLQEINYKNKINSCKTLQILSHYLPKEILWRQKEQFSDGVGYSWIDELKELVEERVSDSQMENAHFRFPVQTPKNKEEYFYRSIFEKHFPSDTAALCVPSEPSVACSSPAALAWDSSFTDANEPSGRAISSVHDKAYAKA